MNSIKKLGLGLVLAGTAGLIGYTASSPQEYKATVLKVSDGDTFSIILDDTKEKVTCRLAYVDAPETPKHGKNGQPYGEESQRALVELINEQQITVQLGARTYQRRVCKVFIKDKNISKELLNVGAAWAYLTYIPAKEKQDFIHLEQTAREKKLGLWKQNNPQEPWIYRKLLKESRKKQIP